MLDAIANIVDINRISSSSIRELSHTFPWSSYYQTIKANPFTPSQLTGDLLSLLQFSRWYEWVRQHPDCPDSKIIDDDDMIDGWFLLKEREKPVKDSNLVEAGDRNVEKFYIAHTQEEADDIYRRNNRGAASIIYNRTKQLAEHGPTIDSNLNDVKFDGMVRANNLANSKR